MTIVKILYVSTVSGTINLFLVPHIHLLLDAGHVVDMACRLDDPINQTLLDRGCKIFPMDFQRSPLDKSNYTSYQNLKSVIDNGNYKWVHTHTPVASALVRLACRGKKDVTVIYTAHGFHFFKGSPMKNWLAYYPVERWLSGYTDVLITINQEDYDFARKKFHAKRVELVNGVGVDLKRFTVPTDPEKRCLRQKYGFDPDAFILVYAAALNNGKHQDVLIKAMSQISREIPNCKLLLLGKGPNREAYQKLIDHLNLQKYVEMMGYRKDVDKLMRLSDVAVSASSREGLPVNVMEAMAIGLPLVVSDCRGNRDLVKDGQNGFLIKEDYPEKYAESIMKIYAGNGLREDMKRENVEAVKKYGVENVLNEMDALYKQLLR